MQLLPLACGRGGCLDFRRAGKFFGVGARDRGAHCLEDCGDAIEGPWDGEEAITLLPDLEAGCTGAMTGGGYPDGIRQIMDPWFAGNRDQAIDAYTRWLPLINYENRQGGILSAKALMKEGGIIASDVSRHPFPAMNPAVRSGLIETAKRLDPLVFRWGK